MTIEDVLDEMREGIAEMEAQEQDLLVQLQKTAAITQGMKSQLASVETLIASMSDKEKAKLLLEFTWLA